MKSYFNRNIGISSDILLKAFNNKILHYIFSQYVTYFIQFINSLFIAVYLGPYYLGVWGFITLIIQYLNQINLGIAHSVNAIISIKKNKKWYVEKIIGTSFTMLIVLSIVMAISFAINEIFDLNLGDKYNFSKYALFVVIIGILGNFNMLFNNIFRVYGRLFEIAFNQAAFPVLMLVVIMLFKGDNLLWALVVANLLAFLASFVLFLVKSPVSIRPIADFRLIKTIQIKGWHLFVYNTSFYLIVISTRSFVSAYYSVEEFGYFTFAFSLANVILLLLQSFSYLIYPKMLNRFATMTRDNTIELLHQIRNAYILTSHGLVHLAILFFPLFVHFFPQYKAAGTAFKLIALTVVLYTNSFGYSGLLIAKGKEKILGVLSIISLSVNIMIAYVLITVGKVSFSLVILTTMITYFSHVMFLGYLGRKILSLNNKFFAILNDVFELPIILSFIVSLFLIFTNASSEYFIIPLLSLTFMKLKSAKEISSFALKVLNSKQSLDY